ncbi:MAG: hypothetical protein JWM58_4606 [Rhizobium sp.]|nr:hypothetical protein [Rhizobium sp.]
MPGKRFTSSSRHPTLAAVSTVVMALMLANAGPVHALTDSEKTPAQQTIEDRDNAVDPLKDQESGDEEQMDDAKPGLPMPDSLLGKPGDKADDAGQDDKVDDTIVPAEIVLDLNRLPEPVKRMRVAIVEAAASGDIERLRPLLQSGADATQVSIGDAPEDPIAALKSLSGDKEGREVLGILLDIISTSAAHVDKGTPNELYVWPYFAEKPLDSLTPPEIVELYRIVTAADVADMKEFGSYNFYRIGISPDGKWKFFVAGD